MDVRPINWLTGFHKKRGACSLSFVSWPDMIGISLQPQCWNKESRVCRKGYNYCHLERCPGTAWFLVPLSMWTWLREAWSKQPSWCCLFFRGVIQSSTALGEWSMLLSIVQIHMSASAVPDCEGSSGITWSSGETACSGILRSFAQEVSKPPSPEGSRPYHDTKNSF